MSATCDVRAAKHLRALVTALDNSFISSWQSTAGWDKQLDEARGYLEQLECTCQADDMPFGRCCKAARTGASA